MYMCYSNVTSTTEGLYLPVLYATVAIHVAIHTCLAILNTTGSRYHTAVYITLIIECSQN